MILCFCTREILTEIHIERSFDILYGAPYMYSIGAHTAVDVHHKHAVALTAFTFFWEKKLCVLLNFEG